MMNDANSGVSNLKKKKKKKDPRGRKPSKKLNQTDSALQIERKKSIKTVDKHRSVSPVSLTSSIIVDSEDCSKQNSIINHQIKQKNKNIKTASKRVIRVSSSQSIDSIESKSSFNKTSQKRKKFKINSSKNSPSSSLSSLNKTVPLTSKENNTIDDNDDDDDEIELKPTKSSIYASKSFTNESSSSSSTLLLIKCQICNQIMNTDKKTTIKCTDCCKYFHLKCIDPPITNFRMLKGYAWICKDCTSSHSESEEEEKSEKNNENSEDEEEDDEVDNSKLLLLNKNKKTVKKYQTKKSIKVN